MEVTQIISKRAMTAFVALAVWMGAAAGFGMTQLDTAPTRWTLAVGGVASTSESKTWSASVGMPQAAQALAESEAADEPVQPLPASAGGLMAAGITMDSPIPTDAPIGSTATQSLTKK